MTKPKEIRALAAYPHSWGPGKVHAAIYFRHRMWDRGWFPICTLDHIHAGEPTKVRRSQLGEVVTCKKCLAKLGRQDHPTPGSIEAQPSP